MEEKTFTQEEIEQIRETFSKIRKAAIKAVRAIKEFLINMANVIKRVFYPIAKKYREIKMILARTKSKRIRKKKHKELQRLLI